MIDELAREVLSLARTQGRTRFENAAAPRHDEVVASCGLASRLELAEAAIAILSPERNETTARVLFGDHPKRWELALGERRKVAGKLVGFNPETFRKKDSEGSSDYERLAFAVASAMMQLGHESAGPGSGPAPPTERSHPLHRLALVVAVAALAATAAVAGMHMSDRAEPTNQVAGVSVTRPATQIALSATPALAPTLTGRPIPAATKGCDIPVGAAINPGAIPAEVTAAIGAEHERMGGLDIVGCPTHAAALWEGFDFWAQSFEGSAVLAPGAAVTRADMPQALWVEQSLLESYLRTAGSQLPSITGPPVSYSDSDGVPTVRLSSGGLIVAQQPGGPAFWIPVEAVEDWGGPRGEFGLPMTDVNYVDGALTQHYEVGQMAMVAENELAKFFPTPAEVDAWLVLLIGSPPGIVRTFDSTAWWIDEQGHRRWIPTAEVWECVGGDAAVLAQEIPGWAIGSAFPLGPTMTCE